MKENNHMLEGSNPGKTDEYGIFKNDTYVTDEGIEEINETEREVNEMMSAIKDGKDVDISKLSDSARSIFNERCVNIISNLFTKSEKKVEDNETVDNVLDIYSINSYTNFAKKTSNLKLFEYDSERGYVVHPNVISDYICACLMLAIDTQMKNTIPQSILFTKSKSRNLWRVSNDLKTTIAVFYSACGINPSDKYYDNVKLNEIVMPGFLKEISLPRGIFVDTTEEYELQHNLMCKVTSDISVELSKVDRNIFDNVIEGFNKISNGKVHSESVSLDELSKPVMFTSTSDYIYNGKVKYVYDLTKITDMPLPLCINMYNEDYYQVDINKYYKHLIYNVIMKYFKK